MSHTPPPYEEESDSDNTAQQLLSSGYEIIHHVDSNDYSVVYLGNVSKKAGHKKVSHGQKIIIKTLKGIFSSAEHSQRVVKELRILHCVKHNNIVKLYDIIPPKNAQKFRDLTLILEFVPSNLRTIFKTNQFFTTLHIQYMLYQIVLGIRYLHSVAITHLNLSSKAILISQNCGIKISDFRNVQNYAIDTRFDTANETSKLYTAPEIIMSTVTITSLPALDVWSIGCIFGDFLQMLKENVSNVRDRKPMFDGTLQNIYSVIGTPQNMGNKKQSRLQSLFVGSDETTLDLITNLLRFESEARLTITEALAHAYFDCVRDVKLEKNKNKNEKIKDLRLEFGDGNTEQMRSLILEQVSKYSQNKRYERVDIVLMGYIRKYIIPLLFEKNVIQIPKFVNETLCMYISLL